MPWMPLEAILSKSGNNWIVGGVASNFFRDLDGDAIAPDAIQQAIPGFMANRGPDGLSGGPLRLHHGFWERFLEQAVNSLSLPYDEQMGLLTAIALPLGRVTEMTVGPDGTTRWRGVLSQANPIAKTIWAMLKEGMVHLGVSVGGKINSTRPGRDALGRPCTVITDVRLDELSITDNPANRLLDSESPDNGAYIMALTKSLEKAIAPGQMAMNFDEQAHPREQGGRFASKGGAGAGAKAHGQGGQSFKFHTENTAYVDAKTPEEAHQKLHQHLSSTPHYSKFAIHANPKHVESYTDDDGETTGSMFAIKFRGKHHVMGNDERHASDNLDKHYAQTQRGKGTHPDMTIENDDWSPIKTTLQKTLASMPTPVSTMASVEQFLAKALGGNPGAEINSGSQGDTAIPSMGRGLSAPPATLRPVGTQAIKMDSSSSDTAGRGLAGTQPKAQRLYSSGGMPPTDVWGLSIDQLTRELAKCARMDKHAWGLPETAGFITDSAHAIAGMTESPNPELINFVRFLQNIGRFAQEMPHMDDYQAAGTVVAMNNDLTKALEEFVETLPSDLKGKPMRAPGSVGVVGMDIQFPKQYVIYS
jgi:hypothetical protein